jgi:phosphatidylserine/phosphatidylglycerophosphate/cardiolipin synthase-like enzyme
MRYPWVAAALLIATIGVAAHVGAASRDGGRIFAAIGTVEVAFTPGDPVDAIIIEAIDAAQTQVLVHAYSFTHRRIADALIRAHRRGVAIAVLADREQARALPHNVLQYLSRGGVEVWMDAKFQAAHNKVIVIDADSGHATTITGSYNFTFAAQRSNAENILVLRDNPPIAQAYRANWQRLKVSATPWVSSP